MGLIHWEGFSLVEVSRILAMKEGTVRSRYHRARASLRSQLQLEHQRHTKAPGPSPVP
ncbi:RNA polymerase sigma factor [Microbacterium lushaniae]|uniref:RNA polymerase sigma factor n=1 Tax=Microbacterium lushaniae TaxID=2614639 RepID=UPI0023AFC6A7|nr:sigma factor-like helix-turn-helix DNA-binding protein [Microbacterium lushaniae]